MEIREMIERPVPELLKLAARYNPRKISPHDFASLRLSLAKFGAVEPVVVNVRTNRLVGGHQRLKAADAEGFSTFPVVEVDLTETEERQLNIALNRIAGEWDEEKLIAVLDEIEAADGDLALTGFDDAELVELLGALEDEETTSDEEKEDPDEIPDPDAVEKRCEPGDLWILGAHRLLCADSTEQSAVDRLMAGRKPNFVFTDPPYGVNVSGKGGKAIEGDLSFTAIPLFFDMLDRTLAAKCWVYICGGQSNMALYSRMFERYFRELPRLIIWDKGKVAVLRANGYHSCFEIVYYTFRGGSGGWWFSGRTSDEADDIWRQSVEHGANRLHPTQKPVEVPLRAIANTCPEDGLIWEPFAGSGSTLIAAQMAERSCFAMEIAPEYCDVILTRWEKFTGLKAVLDVE